MRSNLDRVGDLNTSLSCHSSVHHQIQNPNPTHTPQPLLDDYVHCFCGGKSSMFIISRKMLANFIALTSSMLDISPRFEQVAVPKTSIVRCVAGRAAEISGLSVSFC
ncbi:tRNA-uridine aminocarboxypropyltransferase [Psidium guajava]|nr:tRNA-uridine aminocarboxypropyltransferase [Psidium guajava]